MTRAAAPGPREGGKKAYSAPRMKGEAVGDTEGLEVIVRVLAFTIAASWGAEEPCFEARGALPSEPVLDARLEADLRRLVEHTEPAVVVVVAEPPPPPLLEATLPSGRKVDSVEEAALFDLIRLIGEAGDDSAFAHVHDPAVLVLGAASAYRAGNTCLASQLVRYLHTKESLSPEVSEALAWLDPRVALAAAAEMRFWCAPFGLPMDWERWMRKVAAEAEPTDRENLARVVASRGAMQILLHPEADPKESFEKGRDERSACGMLELSVEIGLAEELRTAAERTIVNAPPEPPASGETRAR